MTQARTLLCAALLSVPTWSAPLFVNFETAPVHPIALSPSGKTLAACNLPDGSLELYTVAEDGLQHRARISVGIDPVTVRFRNEREIWVVNALSDSIDVIDAQNFTVSRVISTRARPADVVFASEPIRAYVSCPPDNVVQVFDLESGLLQETVRIDAERPRALAVSPDRKKVYVAIFESGNGTTIVAPRLTELTHAPAAGPIDLPIGP